MFEVFSGVAGTFFYIIVCISIGVVLFVQGLRSYLLKKMIQNIPTTKIRSAAMGLVEIYGEVVPIKTQKSPLSEDRCVYYKFDVEKPNDKPDITIDPIMNKVGLNKFASIESREAFYVKDETGMILVDPSTAKIDIDYTHRMESSSGRGLSEFTMNFLEGKDIQYKHTNQEYVEYLIRPGDNIYVMGTAVPNPDKAYSKNHTENAVISKGDNDRMFYISDKSEKETLSHLGWKTVTGIFGGMAIIITFLSIGVFLYIALTPTI
jgi:hypothetical protein